MAVQVAAGYWSAAGRRRRRKRRRRGKSTPFKWLVLHRIPPPPPPPPSPPPPCTDYTLQFGNRLSIRRVDISTNWKKPYRINRPKLEEEAEEEEEEEEEEVIEVRFVDWHFNGGFKSLPSISIHLKYRSAAFFFFFSAYWKNHVGLGAVAPSIEAGGSGSGSGCGSAGAPRAMGRWLWRHQRPQRHRSHPPPPGRDRLDSNRIASQIDNAQL